MKISGKCTWILVVVICCSKVLATESNRERRRGEFAAMKLMFHTENNMIALGLCDGSSDRWIETAREVIANKRQILEDDAIWESFWERIYANHKKAYELVMVYVANQGSLSMAACWNRTIELMGSNLPMMQAVVQEISKEQFFCKERAMELLSKEILLLIAVQLGFDKRTENPDEDVFSWILSYRRSQPSA